MLLAEYNLNLKTERLVWLLIHYCYLNATYLIGAQFTLKCTRCNHLKPIFSKFFGGACPHTPLACKGLWPLKQPHWASATYYYSQLALGYYSNTFWLGCLSHFESSSYVFASMILEQERDCWQSRSSIAKLTDYTLFPHLSLYQWIDDLCCCRVSEMVIHLSHEFRLCKRVCPKMSSIYNLCWTKVFVLLFIQTHLKPVSLSSFALSQCA